MNPDRVDPGLRSAGDEVVLRRSSEVVEATAREVDVSASSTRRPSAARNGPAQPQVSIRLEDDLAAEYRRLYPSLVRTAYLLVDTREQAEEVVQDAFAKAFPKWERLRVPEAYVRTCVINGCRRVQRRRGLARRLVVPPDAAPSNEHDHIADAVRRLPSPQREVVVLRYYLQATDAEIADALRLAVGTVKSSLHRARATLRAQLTPNEEDHR